MLEPSEIVRRTRIPTWVDPTDMWAVGVHAVIPHINQFVCIENDLWTMASVAYESMDDDQSSDDLLPEATDFFINTFVEDTMFVVDHNLHKMDFTIGVDEQRHLYVNVGNLMKDGFSVLYSALFTWDEDKHFVVQFKPTAQGLTSILPGEERPLEADAIAILIGFIITMLVIMSQDYSDVTEVIPSNRAEKRRLERTGVPISQFKHVSLRRRKTAKGEPTGDKIDWSHRWTVRPHWRNQWYPSLGIHKRKFIHSYVKGPEDKDLVVKPTFFKP